MSLSGKSKQPQDASLRWSLGKNDTLLLKREGLREEILARGRILSAGSARITAGIEQTQKDQKPVLKTITLGGRWNLDTQNRLVFTVARSDRKKDALVFNGAWKAGANNEIAYGRSGGEGSFRLAGQWRLEGRALSYVLETGNVLRVRGELGTGSIRAKAGELRYRLGAEARKGRRLRELILFGAWKAGRDLGLEFEAECESGRKPVFRFGAVYEWGRDRLGAHLTAAGGKPLGLEISFERPFRGASGEAFVRLKRSAGEALAETGLSFRW